MMQWNDVNTPKEVLRFFLCMGGMLIDNTALT